MRFNQCNTIDSEMKEFLQDVAGVVEATSYERMCLWKECTKESGYSWVSDNTGFAIAIGFFTDKRPVVLEMCKILVKNKSILFINPTSVAIDHDMIKLWLNMNLPITARYSDGVIKFTDPMNFHNLLS